MVNDKITLAVAEAYSQMQTEKLGTIYCDMDGVLADFMKGAHDVLGHAFDDKDLNKMNPNHKQNTRDKVAKHPGFWEDLPLMPGALQLWKFINKYNAHILTAYPSWDPGGKKGKRIWVKKHLNNLPDERFHAVQRAEKQDYAKTDGKPNILIDDYIKNIKEFEAAGGIGIHHIDAETTISKLKKLGFR